MASTPQQDVIAIRFLDSACLAIIMAVGYDYVLTLPEEVEYIWNKPWTGVSTLYVVARYSGLCAALVNSLLGTSFLPVSVKAYVFMLQLLLIDVMSKQLIVFYSCEILNISVTWIFDVFICAADLAMILRVWILYKKSILIPRTLLTLYAIEVVFFMVNCITLSTNFLGMAPVVTQVQVLGFSFCMMQSNSSLGMWLGATSDIIQIILGGFMCLLVGVQFARQSLQMYRATMRFELGHYMNLLTREGMFYYVAILSYAVVDLLGYMPGITMTVSWWWNMFCPMLQLVPAFTLTPRLILTLRKLYVRVPRQKDTDTPAPFTSMDSGRDEGGTFMFESTGQEEGLEQDGEIQMVERYQS